MQRGHDLGFALAVLALTLGGGARPAAGGGAPATAAGAARAAAGSDGAAPAGRVRRLTLADAVRLGLEHNLAAVLAAEAVQAANGARVAAASALLPHLSAGVAEAREKINLEAYGLPLAPGESPLIGPFDVFDARLSFSQAILDLAAAGRARAGRERLAAARFTAEDARDAVVGACARLYLEAVSGESRVAAVRAQERTAQALYDRAVDLRAQGMVAGIEVLRAEVELETARQRVIVQENRAAKLRLELARAIGVPLDDALDLVDRLPYAALEAPDAGDAVGRALAHRADVRAAEAALRAAEAERSAARGSGLPAVIALGDVGSIGNSPGGAKETYSLMAAVRVPLFEGGRVRGETLAAEARVRAEQARLGDLRTEVELEVRSATLDLASAADRVKVGKSTVELANLQLEQARDRFSAGVASNVEVVQAQEAVATATGDYLAAVLDQDLARVALARALGMAEESAGDQTGGTP